MLIGSERNSMEIFLGRDEYAKYIADYNKWFYQDRPALDPHTVCLWCSRGLYGRVDTTGLAIEPRTEEFEYFSDTPDGPEHIMFGFVRAAWISFVNYFSAICRKHTIRTQDFWDLTIDKTWSNPLTDYQNYLGKIVSKFWDWVLQNGMQYKIRSKADLVMAFLNFELYSSEDPVTYTGFLLSPYASVRNSGLVIEIKNDDFSNDVRKIQKYFDRSVYDIFFEAARRFGFLVDQNAPWRLIADIDSLATQYYIRRGIDLEILLREYKARGIVEELATDMDEFLADYSTAPMENIRQAKRIPTEVVLGIYYTYAGVDRTDAVQLLQALIDDLFCNLQNVVLARALPHGQVPATSDIYARLRHREQRRVDDADQFVAMVQKKMNFLDKKDVLLYIG